LNGTGLTAENSVLPPTASHDWVADDSHKMRINLGNVKYRQHPHTIRGKES
jgi:hypothetical protein